MPGKAAKLLLKGLGLVEIITSGLANEGFISAAIREADISIKGEDMTFSQMTLMLYNALLADCYSVSGSIGANATYDTIEGESLLYKTRKLRYGKNELLTAANGTSIYEKSSGAKEVIIGDVEYYTESGEFSDFLGRYVDFVYSEEDGPELVWVVLNGRGEEVFVTIGDEGGYAPMLKKDEDALAMIVAAIEKAGYLPGEICKYFIVSGCCV